jgi:CRP-like cAMP-binding protein
MMVDRVPATPAEIQRIRNGIDTNPLFKYLDDHQKQKLIELARPRRYTAGTYIIREEDMGDFFYVIDSGDVQVLQKGESGSEVVHGRFHPGESFGDKAMVFDTRRSASVKALQDTECWTIDRSAFHKIITSSPIKRSIFEKFASSVDEKSKEKVMRPADFMRSIASDLDLKGKTDEEVISEVMSRFPRLATLFGLVDKDGSGMVDYLEYCLFDVIASKVCACAFSLIYRQICTLFFWTKKKPCSSTFFFPFLISNS